MSLSLRPHWQRRAACLALTSLLLGACASAPAPSTQQVPSMSPAESHAAAATPDPSRFTSETSGTPAQEVRSTETSDGVSVADLAFDNGRGGVTDAYLVSPEAGGSGAAIVWFHWVEYGDPTSNRTEFLDETKELAGRGVVSLLVQGTLPWLEAPTAVAADSAGVEAEVVMVHRGLDLLRGRPDVDAARLALVGHDFGGMYAAVAAASDPGVAGLAMMTPTARWADWFARYWQVAEPADVYAAGMASLDPVTWLPVLGGRPVLLQVGSADGFVPAAVVADLRAAIGAAGDVREYPAGHELNAEARAERAAWLAELLGF